MQRATCSEGLTAAGVPQEYIDVFVTSDPTAEVTVSDSTVPPVISGTVPLTGNNAGKFYGHVPSTGAHGAGPFPITVTAATPGAAPTTVTVNVVDNVDIIQATYSPGSGVLTVSAISSDGEAVLTLADFNSSVANDGITPTTVSGVTVPPPTVTVTSTMGGSSTAAVVIMLP